MFSSECVEPSSAVVDLFSISSVTLSVSEGCSSFVRLSNVRVTFFNTLTASDTISWSHALFRLFLHASHVLYNSPFFEY